MTPLEAPLHRPRVLRRDPPTAPAVALVVDSPHSGTDWPDDFAPAAPAAAVRRTEDALVHELAAAAPACGAVLLQALFPRVYIDPNRPLDDLDPALLAEPWPGPLAPGEKSRLGKGLIWRLAPPATPIYAAPLAVAAVAARIEGYWRPYHAALREALDAAAGRFGGVVHLNCHSMKSRTTAMDAEGPGHARPDIVLSDRDGTTCAPELMALARGVLEARGLSVALNEPFKGAELIRAYADPRAERHALQIEVNRRLYLDEDRLAPSAGFAAIQDALTELIRALAQAAGRLYPG